MGKFPIITENFYGGQSADLKLGTPAAFGYSRHMDFRKSPSQLSILPATVKESSTTVTDVVTDMIQLPSGAMVAIDQGGGVYQRAINGTWTKNATTLPNTAAGLVYNQQQDTIYIPGLTAMHSITNADGRFGGSFTVNANTFVAQVDQSSANGHANTYSPPSGISESATNLLSIIPTIEPLYSVKIWVTTKDTASLTVTMHDAANNLLGTSTVANGSLSNGAYNEFVFSVPVRMLAAPNPATYHFHITQSGGSPTVGASTSSDFSTADYQSLSNRFVQPVNGFHPIYEFLQYYCILNERYLAVWEPISQVAPLPTEFRQHRLTFPSGYQGTSGGTWTEYFAVACEKRSTSATNEFQDGKIFLWDGISTTYNIIIDVPEGAPYGLFSHKNVLYYFAGGSWYAWSGNQPVKIFQMPNTDFEYNAANRYILNNPHTITVRNSILMAAFPSETNSTTIEHAVYSFGARDKNYPNSFGYSYSMSTLSRTNGTLRLGMVKNFGDKMFLSWRDGSSYGVDKVDPNSVAFASGSWESLINDFLFISIKRKFSRPDKQKEAVYLKVTFPALPAGVTLTPKYKIDRAANWTFITDAGQVAAGPGDTSVTFSINKRYYEIQWGFDWTSTGANFTPSSVVMMVEMVPEEAD